MRMEFPKGVLLAQMVYGDLLRFARAASVKVRVTSYGHGWEIVLPGSTHATYVGSFEEVWPVFDEFCAQVQVSAWLDIYRMRMGTEAQTRGMA